MTAVLLSAGTYRLLVELARRREVDFDQAIRQAVDDALQLQDEVDEHQIEQLPHSTRSTP